MTITELRNKLDYYIETNRSNLNVVIKTSNKSIGVSSSVNAADAFQGIDWDHNTLFIYPEVELVKRDLNRDVKLEPLNFNETFPHLADPTSRKIIWICANCEEKVSSKDNYCRNCGQRLKD